MWWCRFTITPKPHNRGLMRLKRSTGGAIMLPLCESRFINRTAKDVARILNYYEQNSALISLWIVACSLRWCLDTAGSCSFS